MPGVYHQYRQVCVYTSPDHRVSGSHSRPHQHGATTTPCQNKANLSRVSSDNEDDGVNLNLYSSTPAGQNELNRLCNSPYSPLLSKPADGTCQHPREPLPGLWESSNLATSQPGRTGMVEHSNGQMEWQDSP